MSIFRFPASPLLQSSRLSANYRSGNLMKLISFIHRGKASYGVLAEGGQGIVDLSGRLAKPDLKAALSVLDDVAARSLWKETPDYRLYDVEFLPVIPNPERVLCVGVNYKAHLEETGRQQPAHPMIFTR